MLFKINFYLIFCFSNQLNILGPILLNKSVRKNTTYFGFNFFKRQKNVGRRLILLNIDIDMMIN